MNATRPLDRLATLAALLGGAAWVTDTLIITARNDSFGLADSALFLFGMGAIVLASGLVAAMAARRSTGARRVLPAIAVFAGIVLGLTILSIAADGLSHSLYAGGNRGLHKECGIFAMGVAAIAAAGWLESRSRSASIDSQAGESASQRFHGSPPTKAPTSRTERRQAPSADA
jgi:hypothetical protein